MTNGRAGSVGRRTWASVAATLLLLAQVPAVAQASLPEDAPSDPAALAAVEEAIERLAATGSFHVRDDITGTAIGGPPGTPAYVEGDVSLATGQARWAFDLPLFVGTGEMLFASDGNFYTRFAPDPTGLWHRSHPGGEGPRPAGQDSVALLDAAGIAATIRGLLRTDGARVVSLGGRECLGAPAPATCDAYRLDLPLSVLGRDADAAWPASPAPSGTASMTADVTVDEATGLADSVTLTAVLPGLGTGAHRVVFSAYGDPFAVDPPPETEVTDEAFRFEYLGPGS